MILGRTEGCCNHSCSVFDFTADPLGRSPPARWDLPPTSFSPFAAFAFFCSVSRSLVRKTHYSERDFADWSLTIPSEHREMGIEMPNHASADVRRRAVLASGNGREAILLAMADPAWVVREAAAIAASRLPELHANLISLTLNDPIALVRTAAARGASSRIDPERDFATAARHPFERQRMRALIAVGYTPSAHASAALRILATGLADSHPKVRRAALLGLAAMPPDVAVELLPEVIRRGFETEPAVRDTALSLCGSLFASRAADRVRPLRPFVGVADLTELIQMFESLPPHDRLRRAWDAIGEPRTALPILLERLCRAAMTSSAP